MDTRARDSASNIPLTGVSCVLRWVVLSSEDSSSDSFARKSSCFKSSLNDISPRHTPGFSSTLPYISCMLSPPSFCALFTSAAGRCAIFRVAFPQAFTTPGGERWSRDLLLHRSAHNNTAQPTEWGGGGARVEKGVKAGGGGRHR